MYIAYKCKTCRKSFILLEDEVRHSELESRYITCPYHAAHRDIIVTGKYDDLKECMEKHPIFKRVNGKMKQIK